MERQHTYHPLYDGPFAGYFWLRVQLLQAQLYARQSRIAESRTLAEEMVTLLRHADSKFPVLLEAQRLLRSYPLHTAH